MNDHPEKRGGSGFAIALAIMVGVLLLGAAVWLRYVRTADSADITLVSQAPLRPTDISDIRERAEDAADTLQGELQARTAGAVSVSSDPATGSLATIRAGVGGDLFPEAPGGISPAAKVNAFLAEHGGQFGIDDPARQLKLLGVEKDQYGYSHVDYQQMHGKVRVLGAILKGHVSPDGRLTAVNGKFVPGVDVPATAVVARSEASQWAVAQVVEQQPSAMKGVELTVKSAALIVYRTNLTRGAPGINHLAYEVQVTGGNHVREFVYIDALTGKLVDQISGIHGIKHRELYQGAYAPPVPPVWQEGDFRPDPNDTHEDEISGTGYSYNLFFNLSGGSYRSWDGADATMITVDTDPTIVCPNANWNGTSTNYCLLTAADDVVAHEWSHAYTQETSGLIYSYQSGALNESYSDVFGETVDLINNRDQIGGATPFTGNNGPRSQDDSVCSTHTSEEPTTDD